MKHLLFPLLLGFLSVPAQAQPKDVAAPTDGFPPLPTFDVRDTTTKQNKADIQQENWPPQSVGYNPTLNLLMQEPFKGLPENDRSTVTVGGNIPGEVVYITEATVNGISRSFFVFIRKKNSSLAGQKNEDVVSYMCAFSEFIGNPALSPDRKNLMFQVGSLVDIYGGYTICLWDFSKKSISVGKELVAFPKVVWSPDSSYIGYFFGGDKTGYWTDPNHPPHLHIQNVKTGEVQVVPRQFGVNFWSWTNKGTLLFTQFLGKPLPPKSQQKSDIFEFNPQSKTSNLLIKNAAQPSPSPDNRWVAFTASESDATGKEETAPDDSFSLRCGLYDRQSRRIFRAVEPTKMAVHSYLWDSASQRLYSFQITKSSMESGKQVKHCSISVANVAALVLAGNDASLKWDKTTEFNCISSKVNANINLSALRITKDRQYLIYKVKEDVRDDQGTTIESLNAINLTNGQSEVLFSKVSDINTSVGFDWNKL